MNEERNPVTVVAELQTEIARLQELSEEQGARVAAYASDAHQWREFCRVAGVDKSKTSGAEQAETIARLTALLTAWGIPPACRCEPESWGYPRERIEPICDHYKPESAYLHFCTTCGHNEACHKEA